jgi:hypothetical protein
MCEDRKQSGELRDDIGIVLDRFWLPLSEYISPIITPKKPNEDTAFKPGFEIVEF